MGLKDREILLALKQEEHKEKGLPFDGEFYIWDYRFYDRKYIEKTLDLDDMLVKEYFPVDVVVPAILECYQNLLGVKFVETKGSTWHPGTLLCHDQRVRSRMFTLCVCRGTAIRCLGKGRERRVWLHRILLLGPLPSRYAASSPPTAPHRTILTSIFPQRRNTHTRLFGACFLATLLLTAGGVTRSQPWSPTSQSRRQESPRSCATTTS